MRWRTIAEILTALDHPLDSLRRGRALDPRHVSLRAVIDDSYRLLDRAEQNLLADVSVFASPFTATVAQHVRSTPAEAADDTPALLGILVDHSLLRAEPRPSGTRFMVLDTVRHYGIEQLEHGRALPAARARHAHAMLELTESATTSLWGPDEAVWVDRIGNSRPDICAAHETLLSLGDQEGALRLATAGYLVAWPRSWSDLRQLIDAEDQFTTTASVDVLAPALSLAADFANFAGDAERGRRAR